MIELQVRFGQFGHRCRTGANRSHRTLKKLFQESGVPVWLRGHVPLIFQGERLIAIAGVTVCHGRRDETGLSFQLLWSGFAWERDWPWLGRLLESKRD